MTKFALRDNVHLVSGFNLPLLIEILLSDIDTPVNEVIENAIGAAKEQMVYVNKLMNPSKENSTDD
jgi:fructoselysine and glucoselysine-specific PTS system IIA component